MVGGGGRVKARTKPKKEGGRSASNDNDVNKRTTSVERSKRRRD